MVEWGVVHSKF
jgi:hypothetical protein